jgi:hypothetical protein
VVKTCYRLLAISGPHHKRGPGFNFNFKNNNKDLLSEVSNGYLYKISEIIFIIMYEKKRHFSHGKQAGDIKVVHEITRTASQIWQ